MLDKQTYPDRQAGFTLVELAVVMIIIGLLIGGVLNGQELITNAQVTSAVSQMKCTDAAVTTFRDTYAAVPGDMLTATTRLPNCVTNCVDGDGNNHIGAGTTNTAGLVPTGETIQVWRHLSAADLITGVNDTALATFGEGLPKAAIGGGIFLGFYNGTGGLPGSTGGAAVPRAGHYLSLTADPGINVGAAGSAVLRATQAARIDRKMDDGAPESGTVIAASDGTCFVTSGATTIYDEAVDAQACALHVRIQQ